MEKSETSELECVRKKGRTVIITSSYHLSPSTSCPALDEVSFPVFVPRKHSAPIVGAADVARCTSLTSVPSCRSVTPQIKSHHKKPKKHTKALLPNKPLFNKKLKSPSQKAEQPSLPGILPKWPLELNLSESKLSRKKRDRKFSCDLSPVSPGSISLQTRKLSCDLTQSCPTGKQRRKSFFFSLVKLPFSRGRRGSEPAIVEECDSDDDESPSPSPVSIFVSPAGSDQRRRGIIDLDSIDGQSNKNKLSTYNKLLGKSMELVSYSMCVMVYACICTHVTVD